MAKEVIVCSGAKHIGKNIAKKFGAKFQILTTKKFPDGEICVKFEEDVRGKNLIFVQSFFGEISDKIIEVLFAAYNAKDLGAKRIELLSLYPPYFRQDKRFNSGEAISIQILGKLFEVFDKVYFVDPHLHRIKEVKEVFKKGERLSSVNVLTNYIQKLKLKNPVFVGPDIESDQWAQNVAIILGKKHVILRKKRLGDRKVQVKLDGGIDLKNKELVIIDDIISTGHTMLKTIKLLKKFKPKKIYCIAVHGLFLENSLKKLSKYAEILSTNTIPSKVSKIDISGIAEEIK